MGDNSLDLVSKPICTPLKMAHIHGNDNTNNFRDFDFGFPSSQDKSAKVLDRMPQEEHSNPGNGLAVDTSEQSDHTAHTSSREQVLHRPRTKLAHSTSLRFPEHLAISAECRGPPAPTKNPKPIACADSKAVPVTSKRSGGRRRNTHLCEVTRYGSKPPKKESRASRAPRTRNNDRAQAFKQYKRDLEDLAWPWDEVRAWLTSHAVSDEWQAALLELNVYGSQFLDLGRPVGERQIGFMSQMLIPQVAAECERAGLTSDASKQCKEGDRLERLVRDLLKVDEAERVDKGLESSKTSGEKDWEAAVEEAIPSIPKIARALLPAARSFDTIILEEDSIDGLRALRKCETPLVAEVSLDAISFARNDSGEETGTDLTGQVATLIFNIILTLPIQAWKAVFAESVSNTSVRRRVSSVNVQKCLQPLLLARLRRSTRDVLARTPARKKLRTRLYLKSMLRLERRRRDCLRYRCY